MYQKVLCLVKNVKFMLPFSIVTFLCYGTMVLNPTIGVDDTAWKIYFVDGVSPVMGRWVIYLINKILPVAEYNPFLVESFVLFCFMISVLLWTVLFQRVVGKRVKPWVYLGFACVMITAPITTEVITYYLSNGITLGFGFTAISLWYLKDAIENKAKKRIVACVKSGLWLFVALGCYESFVIVLLVGICSLQLLESILEKGRGKNLVATILCTILVGVFGVVVRSIWVPMSIVLFSLESQVGILSYRGIEEIFQWFQVGQGLEALWLVLQEYIVKYFIHGIMYKPITIFVIALAVIGSVSLFFGVFKRNGRILFWYVGVVLSPFLMPILEGYATYYRTSQHIVVVSGLMVLILGIVLEMLPMKNYMQKIGIGLLLILIYHQLHESNYWLKVDQDKYQDALRTMDGLAIDIIENYDESLPICVVGEYEVPGAIASKSYTPTWSGKYVLASRLLSVFDESVQDKFIQEEGYLFTETPMLSVLKWGQTAFYGFDRELIKFWESMGYGFTEDGDLSHYEYANSLVEDGMPVWPNQGSIIELDTYIIVNLGSK